MCLSFLQPNAAKHLSVCLDHFHTHSASYDPALHINYRKRGGDLLIAPDD